MKLVIDPEFRSLIPALSKEEHALLEKSISERGCLDPIDVWNGIIVDGHNRYEICERLDIGYTVHEMDFTGREAVKKWMLEKQLSRRNLNSYQRSRLALLLEETLRNEARLRQATSTGGNEPKLVVRNEESQLVPNLAQAGNYSRTREKLAKIAGVSHGTIDKVKKIERDADESVKRELNEGRKSIYSAYKELMENERGERTNSAAAAAPVTEEKSASEDVSGAPGAGTAGSSMGIRNGRLEHIGVPFERPDGFPYVIDEIESVGRFFIDGLRGAASFYTAPVRSKENDKEIRTTLKDIFNDALDVFKEE